MQAKTVKTELHAIAAAAHIIRAGAYVEVIPTPHGFKIVTDRPELLPK